MGKSKDGQSSFSYIKEIVWSWRRSKKEAKLMCRDCHKRTGGQFQSCDDGSESLETDAESCCRHDSNGRLHPKAFPRVQVSWLQRTRFIGVFSSMLLSIALPFILVLGMVGGGLTLSNYGGIFNWSYLSEDDVPIWTCQSRGFLKGDPWTFLGVNLSLGRMSFNQAKVLDLAWNWVVGRGLQLFLAWLMYPVHTAALMRITEASHVSYDLFTSLALFSTRPASLYDLAKTSVTISRFQMKLIISWLLFSTIYLAALPSLFDVMTGYEASILTQLNLPNKTTIEVTDASDIEGSVYYYTDGTYSRRMCNFYDSALNDSFYRDLNARLATYDQQHNYNGDRPNLHYKASPAFYTQDPKNYNCIAEKGVYSWGFSGEWVLIASCINGFWILGSYILWIDTEFRSNFTRKGRRMGTYRAIADVAEAMQEDLGENISAYSEKELEAALKRRGPVKYYADEGDGNRLPHIGLSSRQSERAKLERGKEYG